MKFVNIMNKRNTNVIGNVMQQVLHRYTKLTSSRYGIQKHVSYYVYI